MATELDKLIVKIEADLGDLKKGMARANDTVKKSTGTMGKNFKNLGNSMANLGGKVIKLGALFSTIFAGIAIKSVVNAGMQIEQLEVRFKALFGTAEEGAKAFQNMLEFASTVPFTLEQIQRGSGSLAVVANDAEELSKLMEITGNVASASGLSFEEASQQIQRAFGNGIASADLFRDRGITALAGFEAGATYSAEETYRVFEELFSGNGKFANVTKDMANTLEGTLSMLGDTFFNFKVAISEDFFVEIKKQFNDLNETLNKNKVQVMEYGRSIGKSMAEATAVIIENLDGIVVALKALGAFLATSAVASVIRMLVTMNPLVRALSLAIAGLSTAMSFFGDSVKENTEILVEETQKLKEFNEEVENSVEEISGLDKAIDTLSMNAEQFDEIMEDAGKSISDAFGDSIAKGEDFRDAMKNIFQDVISQVISLITQLLIVQPLLDGIRSGLGGGTKTSGFMGAIGSAIGGFFGGSFAKGGYVAPNVPVMVGERGAEMFVPTGGGHIVPNNQMGGQGVTINQHLNFSTGVVGTVRAEVMNLMPQIKQETVTAVAEARTRGGAFSRAFGA